MCPQNNCIINPYTCQSKDWLTIDDVIRLTSNKPQRQTSAGWMVCCPCHDDHNPSLHVEQHNSTLLLHCFGCGAPFEKLLQAFGVPRKSAVQRFAIQQINIALNIPWYTRSGPIDQSVYIAVCLIVYRTRKPIVGASEREIAEMANISNNSASVSLRRLCRTIDKNTGEISAKLIRLKDDKYETSVYRLLCTQTLSINIVNDRVCRKSICVFNDMNDRVCGRQTSILNHDIFTYQGLGKSGYQLWYFLQTPISSEDLATKSGRSIDTVNRKLLLMQDLGLVTQSDNVWVQKANPNLYSAAQALGIVGKLSKRKRAHREQRDKYKKSGEEVHTFKKQSPKEENELVSAKILPTISRCLHIKET